MESELHFGLAPADLPPQVVPLSKLDPGIVKLPGVDEHDLDAI